MTRPMSDPCHADAYYADWGGRIVRRDTKEPAMTDAEHPATPAEEHTPENDAPGGRRATIYGDYVAHAISRGASAWHIESKVPGLPLCGRPLNGDLRRLDLHVSLLECSRCMALGGTR